MQARVEERRCGWSHHLRAWHSMPIGTCPHPIKRLLQVHRCVAIDTNGGVAPRRTTATNHAVLPLPANPDSPGDSAPTVGNQDLAMVAWKKAEPCPEARWIEGANVESF